MYNVITSENFIEMSSVFLEKEVCFSKIWFKQENFIFTKVGFSNSEIKIVLSQSIFNRLWRSFLRNAYKTFFYLKQSHHLENNIFYSNHHLIDHINIEKLDFHRPKTCGLAFSYSVDNFFWKSLIWTNALLKSFYGTLLGQQFASLYCWLHHADKRLILWIIFL